jgi:hypothetical protein
MSNLDGTMPTKRYQTMDQTASKNTIDDQRYKTIRDRWDKEDTLLISRTGIFLTTNSIMYAALGFQAQNPGFQVGVAVIGLALSILWLTTSWHTANVIKKLHLMCKSDMPYDLADIYSIKPILFRPNTVFGKIIPLLMISGWLAFILWILDRFPI